jgi:hypothetical protein
MAHTCTHEDALEITNDADTKTITIRVNDKLITVFLNTVKGLQNVMVSLREQDIKLESLMTLGKPGVEEIDL